MTLRKNLPIILIFYFLFITGCTFAEDDFPINYERLSHRVLILTGGRIYMDQIIAVATEMGLVVIDTGKAPSITARYRKIIEREFGRDDFIYVINTHYHFDHTSGNQVFADAAIIAHQRSPEGMRQFDAERHDFVHERRTRLIPQWQAQLESLDPNSEDALRFTDYISSNKIMCDDYSKNYVLTLPTITFNDRMNLDLGDVTLKLLYFGEGRHTGDDIIVHCPEEKLLFTGDLFYKGSFQIAYSPQFDALRWMDVLNEVLEDENQIDLVFDTHNGRMSGEFLILWRDYLVDLWESLSQAKNQGLGYESLREYYSYDNKFSYIEKSGIDVQQLRREHKSNLEFLWKCILGVNTDR